MAERRVGHVHRLDHVGDRRGRQRGVEGVGLEAHQHARPVLGDRVRRRRQDVEGHPRKRAVRLDARRDARHAEVADDDQPRRPAQLEPGAERRRERARHEVDGHEPAAALFDRRRRQRDDPAAGRGERLPGGQGDRLRFGRDGQPAGERVFTGGEIEQPRQVVQREHLLAVQQAHGQRTPRALREHGEGSRGRRLSRQREREKDGETNRQGADCREASQRQNASIITFPRALPLARAVNWSDHELSVTYQSACGDH